jgi:F-type H+-transporting ATPase subunit b
MNEILSILSSIGFNWHVALANFINFLVILFLLNKFFFTKIGKVIENRRETIERGLSQASDAERALLHANEEKHILLSMAEKEGHKIIKEATEHAEHAATLIKSNTEKEINARLEVLEEKEKSVEENVERSFRSRAPELVAKLYALTLAKEMTEEENNALIGRIAS